MSLWLRVRQTRASLLTILGVTLALAFTRGWYMALPNLFGGPRLIIPLALFIPLAVAIVVALGFTTGDPLLEAVASRPLYLLDATYALATALLTLTISVCLHYGAEIDLALDAGRNVLGYIGLTLIGRRLAGSQNAAIITSVLAIVLVPFSTSVSREIYWWAWHIAPAHTSLSWGIAVALLLIGIVITLRHTNTTIMNR